MAIPGFLSEREWFGMHRRPKAQLGRCAPSQDALKSEPLLARRGRKDQVTITSSSLDADQPIHTLHRQQITVPPEKATAVIRQ